jgi:hypothetical protein
LAPVLAFAAPGAAAPGAAAQQATASLPLPVQASAETSEEDCETLPRACPASTPRQPPSPAEIADRIQSSALGPGASDSIQGDEPGIETPLPAATTPEVAAPVSGPP